MRKGITPIISTIVLLLITVALAGAAWVYIGGFMGTYTEKSFTIPTGGIYCDNIGNFHVNVVNTGTTTIQSTDWTDKSIVNTSAISTSNQPYINTLNIGLTTVATKGRAEFLQTSGAGAAGTAGTAYMIRIGTVAGIQSIPVVCP